MTDRSVTHATFVVERTCAAPPARVFKAFGDPATKRIWFTGPVSLATVELAPEGAGTRLRYTEQGAFLDGHDVPAQREQGTRELLDTLGAALRHAPASA